jgi:hypothetical protein
MYGVDPEPQPMSEPQGQFNQARLPQEREVLPYESHGPEDLVHRPPWVYVLLALYLATMATLPTIPWWFGWSLGGADAGAVAVLACSIAIFIACGLAMMIVPVKFRRRRPITRRTIWIPILVSGMLAGGLVFGAAMAFAEFIEPYFHAANSDTAGWVVIAAAIGVWIGWAILFGLMLRNRDPVVVGLVLHHWLIAGSILELIVAVPCHIIVRRRDECCGGIATGIGICIGTGVALIAFGPSVFLLYYRRHKMIRQKSPAID